MSTRTFVAESVAAFVAESVAAFVAAFVSNEHPDRRRRRTAYDDVVPSRSACQ